jgi:hypothetical protein
MSTQIGSSADRSVWATDDGAVVFFAGVVNASPGIWTHDAGGLRLSALTGDQAAGATGATLGSIQRPLTRPDRSIAFAAKLFGPSPTIHAHNDTAIILGEYSATGARAHALRVLVREGDPVPADPYERVLALDDGFFENRFEFLSVGDRGHLMFRCPISTPSGAFANSALFVHDGASLRVAAMGEQLTDRGTPVGQLLVLAGFSCVGPQGQVAFKTSTATPLPARDTIVLSYGGQLRVVARAGDWLEVAPGVLRYIEGFFPTPRVDFDRHGNFYLGVDLDAGHRAVISVPARACLADLTGSADPQSAAYGSPDGTLDSEDFFYYLREYAAGNWLVADMTATANPTQPRFGVPDGQINSDDFFFYLSKYAGGC